MSARKMDSARIFAFRDDEPLLQIVADVQQIEGILVDDLLKQIVGGAVGEQRNDVQYLLRIGPNTRQTLCKDAVLIRRKTF